MTITDVFVNQKRVRQRYLWSSKRFSEAFVCLFVPFIRRSLQFCSKSFLFLILLFVFYVMQQRLWFVWIRNRYKLVTVTNHEVNRRHIHRFCLQIAITAIKICGRSTRIEIIVLFVFRDFLFISKRQMQPNIQPMSKIILSLLYPI